MGQSVRDSVQARNRARYGNLYQFETQLISRGTKCMIYRTLVRPIVIYGAARWSLRATDENAPRSFEGRILRKIFGPVWNRSERKISYNADLNA